MQNVTKNLKKPNRKLNQLNFKFCFLNINHIEILCQGLLVSRNLIKLDLSCNGLGSFLGIYVVKRIQVIISLFFFYKFHKKILKIFINLHLNILFIFLGKFISSNS